MDPKKLRALLCTQREVYRMAGTGITELKPIKKYGELWVRAKFERVTETEEGPEVKTEVEEACIAHATSILEALWEIHKQITRLREEAEQ